MAALGAEAVSGVSMISVPAAAVLAAPSVGVTTVSTGAGGAAWSTGAAGTAGRTCGWAVAGAGATGGEAEVSRNHQATTTATKAAMPRPAKRLVRLVGLGGGGSPKPIDAGAAADSLPAAAAAGGVRSGRGLESARRRVAGVPWRRARMAWRPLQRRPPSRRGFAASPSSQVDTALGAIAHAGLVGEAALGALDAGGGAGLAAAGAGIGKAVPQTLQNWASLRFSA